MTSPMSGYVSVMQNLSQQDPREVWRSIAVPGRNMAVIISFRPVGPSLPEVKLYKHLRVVSRDFKLQIWSGSEFESSFASLYYVRAVTKLTVDVKSVTCISTSCFQLFFSFFPKTPSRLPSGLWNCSVDNYSSFQHHLTCNLKTECEDGRDETGHCPFSSPGCQGLVALCDRCYKILWSQTGFDSPAIDLHKKGNDDCALLGGTLGMPKRLRNWYSTFKNITKIVHKLGYVLFGLYFNDISLPNMYRVCVSSNDGTVLHHTVDVDVTAVHGVTHCSVIHDYHIQFDLPRMRFKPCKEPIPHLNRVDVLCEIPKNKTEQKSNHLIVPPLISPQVFLTTWRQPMTVCPDGHVTHNLLLCGSSQYGDCRQERRYPCYFPVQLSDMHGFDSNDHHDILIPTFTCSDELTALSYTLVCDFRSDCPDKSDESFCRHRVCVHAFTCRNGQCVSYDKACNQVTHCKDNSDEENCEVLSCLGLARAQAIPSPALIGFDGIMKFTSTFMEFNESCPVSHYRCPGEFNDCLPVYTRCNGLFDCIDHQDEEGCKDLTCSGFFRCRLSKLCVHSDHLCDDWPHCPMHDDELTCDLTCPVGCLRQGHTFLCFQPFSVVLFPQLRSLNATASGMTLSDVSHNAYLMHLVLAQCSLTLVPQLTLLNLKFLDLSNNRLQQVNMTSFLRLENLQSISLSNNPLSSLHTVFLSHIQQSVLKVIHLSYTALKVFDSRVLAQFPFLQKLNLTFTSIHTISPAGFQFTPRVSEIYMTGSPIKEFPADIFKDLFQLHVITTQNYKLCCSDILPDKPDGLSCNAPKDEVSSCEDLLDSWTYRGFLWLIACLSISGNVFCFCARLLARGVTSSTGFSFFVSNLTLADFLMGVYISIIGAADERYRGRYLHHDDTWKNSVACKMAGFLSLLSSEVSALIICLITLDRFVVLRFPFSNLRFERVSAAVVCLLTWLVGVFLAVIPLLPMTSYWEFYSQTGICIPLPVTRQEFKGRVYSFSVLIAFNFILFILISAGQAFIYWSIQKNALKTNTTKVSRDMTIAQRLISVAVTDFMCWFPIGLCGVLALLGTPIPGEVNVALAIFVLPLNSAVNPFMYTFNILVEKQRKYNEDKILNWMESHMDLIDS